MGFVKHGTGEVLREPEDNAKVAKQNWTAADEAALQKENRSEEAEE